MDDKTFEEFAKSVKQMKAIEAGEMKPARVTRIPEPDVKHIRAAFGLSQTAFAALFGVNVRTLQNWEQGRRHPRGPTRLLLSVLAHNPRVLYEVVHDLEPEEWEPHAVASATPHK